MRFTWAIRKIRNLEQHKEEMIGSYMGGFAMGGKKPQYVWVYQPETPKFMAGKKEEILENVKLLIRQQPKVSQKVSRVEMRANRIYLYELVEQRNTKGAIFIKPLIGGKYLEYPYARITLQDDQGSNCTVDWQRHNNQWITLYSGTLPECIKEIEDDECWF